MIRDSNTVTGKQFVSSPKLLDQLCGPRNLLVNGYSELFFSWLKRKLRKNDLSPPSATDVRSKWNYSFPIDALTFRHHASHIKDGRIATPQRRLFIYLVNKYI